MFAQPGGQMNTQKMLRFFRKHTVEATSRKMTIEIIYRKRQKQLNKKALQLKSTVARPIIYNRAYRQKSWTAFLGKPLGVTNPNLFF